MIAGFFISCGPDGLASWDRVAWWDVQPLTSPLTMADRNEECSRLFRIEDVPFTRGCCGFQMGFVFAKEQAEGPADRGFSQGEG